MAVPFYIPSRRSLHFRAVSAKRKYRYWSRRVISTLSVVNSMNLSPIKSLRNSSRWTRGVRVFTAFALITTVFTATSVRADSVRVDQVVQTLTNYQGATTLKLATQDPAGGTKSSTPTSG